MRVKKNKIRIFQKKIHIIKIKQKIINRPKKYSKK